MHQIPSRAYSGKKVFNVLLDVASNVNEILTIFSTWTHSKQAYFSSVCNKFMN